MCSYWRVVLTTHCLCTSHLFRWLLQINYYGSYLSILLLQKPSVKTLPSFSWTLTPHQVQHTCKWGKNRISKLMKRRSIQHGYKYSVFCSFLFLPTHLCSLWSVLLSYTPNHRMFCLHLECFPATEKLLWHANTLNSVLSAMSGWSTAWTSLLWS